MSSLKPPNEYSLHISKEVEAYIKPKIAKENFGNFWAELTSKLVTSADILLSYDAEDKLYYGDYYSTVNDEFIAIVLIYKIINGVVCIVHIEDYEE